ncbi:Cadherin-related tumor suppressor [Papilio xuthus]|uniref:Cadherin-related tumor suppressor n=1 Tax=Papilio xuthus TaxID=66420 RepID=A0A194PIG7_PAPXU|nr:Cadherin-related tumor suppressor [Papilio xuthus]
MTSMGRWHVVLVAVALLTGAGAGAAAEQMQSRAVDTGVDLRIAEAQPVGTIVGRIPIKPGFTYRFNEPPKEFVLDPISGELKSNIVLDRESVDRYAFVVLSSQPTYPIEVRIRVMDVNDNYPEFPEPSIAVAFSESAAAGTKLLLDAATDKDLGENGITNDYRIVDGDNEGKFRLNVTVNPSGQTSYLHLETTGKLDRETNDFYILNISARDGGSPPKYGYLQVNVTILDVNDNPPIFDQSDFSVSLNESVPPGTVVLKVTATDSDLGDNSKITYEVTDTEKQFAVDPESGVITTLKKEERDYYSLTIVATDNGKPPRSSQVPVVIHVLDENDNSPQFTNTTFIFKIKENEPPDTFVGKLTAIDKDIGRNAELTFSLPIAQNDFRIDSRNGFIRTLKSFDRESLAHSTGQNYITLTVTVSDNGKVKLTDSVRVTIYITDVNDNAPVFTRIPYKVEVSEGATVGGDEMEKFSLDEATGQLFINKPLDRESVDKYQLTVLAHDSGQAIRLSSTTTIHVDVLDENDNAPIFSQTQMKVSVLETEPINKKIIQFHANDADLGINNEIQFSITSGNRKEAFFIDSYSGELFLHKHLDYEDLTSYVLNITATDNGSPSLSSSIPFTVNVIDANDNAPVFTNTAIVRQIREGIPIHTPIVTVTAEDPDSGLNGKVYYSITHQDPNDGRRHFAINNITGVIHTLLPIDRESVDTFRITVVAYDRAEPPSARLSAEKLVTVIVEDINDNAPAFVSMNAAVINSERLGRSLGRGIFIMNVLARDLDSGTNGLVTYKLMHGGTDIFDLHRSNGALVLRYPPAIPEARWNLVIKATDEAVLSEQRSTETYLTVIMGGTELEGITWTNVGSVSVAENEPAGTAILNMTNNFKSALEYYIVNVTGDGRQVDRLFDIDSSLGILSTAVSLDREAGIDRYEVEICAVSSSTPLQSTTTKVRHLLTKL